MPSYFKPLRRKIGVLTLVITCVLMVGWVRSSSSMVDSFPIPFSSTLRLESYSGIIAINEYQAASMWPGPMERMVIPYWQIVLPLTLLSAWLLLSKVRAKPPEKQAHFF